MIVLLTVPEPEPDDAIYSSPNFAQFGQSINLVPSTIIGLVAGASFPHISQIITILISIVLVKIDVGVYEKVIKTGTA
ncbi:MAG: hypothetical protein LHW59_11975 [Candidatus Cloacimonetes bacterium]|nr:hypothetical protein [Candidatus Cloacimonadota bacterium]